MEKTFPSHSQVISSHFLSSIANSVFSDAGNRIGVYGTLDVGVRPQSSYVLDGGVPVVHNITEDFTRFFEGPFLYMARFYESPVLEYGTHTLQVTVDRTYTAYKGYIFDFLTVGVKEEDPASLIIVDENDPAVEYSGQWALEGSEKYEYQGTTHKSNSTGNAAIFKFNGTTIDVYGTINGTLDQTTALVSFQLDGGSTRYFLPIDTQSRLRPKWRMFSTSALSAGEHTLRIESLTPDAFWLDYFIYTPLYITNSPSVSSIPSSSSSTPSTPSSSQPLAPIIGGAIGGFAFAVLIFGLIALFCYRRRRKQTTEPTKNESQPEGPGESLGHPPIVSKPSQRRNVFSTQQTSSMQQLTNAIPVSPYVFGANQNGDQQRFSSSGTGFSGSYQSSSGVQVAEASNAPRFVAPLAQTNNTGRFVAPFPQNDNGPRFVSPLPQPNETPSPRSLTSSSPNASVQRFIAPVPQKYRQQAPRVQQEEPSEYTQSEGSGYTGSEFRDTRSPPPNYSQLQSSQPPASVVVNTVEKQLPRRLPPPSTGFEASQ
jgi:hypothetical protein